MLAGSNIGLAHRYPRRDGLCPVRDSTFDASSSLRALAPLRARLPLGTPGVAARLRAALRAGSPSPKRPGLVRRCTLKGTVVPYGSCSLRSARAYPHTLAPRRYVGRSLDSRFARISPMASPMARQTALRESGGRIKSPDSG